MKRYFYAILMFLIFLFFFTTCQQSTHSSLQGNTMGTLYSVVYEGDNDTTLKKSIDSLLKNMNQQISIFDSTSLISQINQGKKVVLTSDFIYIFNTAQEISKETRGTFDITVGPLVTLWGFGTEKEKIVTQKEIDSVKQWVGYTNVYIENQLLQKKDARITLNFNAIAKGYAVDKVSNFLISKGYPNHLVEIGGEIVVRGKKGKKDWHIGIQIPTKEKDDAIESNYTFALSDKAVATSGNYRNFYEKDAVRYSHIINPNTGIAEHSNLLSVTVIADNCITADAYATAFMVMGVEQAMAFLSSHNELAAYFIYITSNHEMKTMATDNFPLQIQ